MQYAVLFPGQGSQVVGMGADVFAARPDLLGSAADEVLGWSLARVVADGPEAELVRTDRAQPALYAISYALWEAFAVRVSHAPMGAAGHSLGEYTALAASRALDYYDGLRLVAARGAAMARATDATDGAMAAVIGADLADMEKIVASYRNQGAEIWIANVNAPGQIVVAGASSAVGNLAERSRELGLRRVIPLSVAGAFHTPLMAPAQSELSDALGSVEFLPGDFPVWSNLHAAPASDVPASLAGQLTGMVRFSESLVTMREAGAGAFVHIGPGDVTAGMAKRTCKGATVVTVSSLDDVDAAVAALAS
jgi:[acyl-carrier-protein] S-malonyltransferase